MLRIQAFALICLSAYWPLSSAHRYHVCQTPELSEEELEKDSALTKVFESKEKVENDGTRRRLCDGCILIETYFHVLMDDQSNDGFINDTQVDEAISYLNEAYTGTPFRFLLKNITRTSDSNLFEAGGGADAASHHSILGEMLRRGNRTTLNIYSMHMLPATLGLATFPSGFNGVKDGVFIDYCVVPNSGCIRYTNPEIIAHEVGHWLGLFHTFQGGCNDVYGDFVSDTPAMASAVYNCYFSRNSCPDTPEEDPLDNIMGYALSCMVAFTPGQIQRMYDEWMIYRQGTGACSADEGVLSVELKLDSDPEENSWMLFHANGQLLSAAGFGVTEEERTQTVQICAPHNKPMYFTLEDKGGNGLQDTGEYKVRFDGKLIRDNIDFGSRGAVAFTMVKESGCPQGEGLVQVAMLLDAYPTENSFKIVDSSSQLVYSEDPFALGGNAAFYKHASIWREMCLSFGSYSFVFSDSFGDGLSHVGARHSPFIRILANKQVVVEDRNIQGNGKTVDFTIASTGGFPTLGQTGGPSVSPSLAPSVSPAAQPSYSPTTSLFLAPSKNPTGEPTSRPSEIPSTAQTSSPTMKLTKGPTANPTIEPTKRPSLAPSESPTLEPTSRPSASRTTSPTSSPTMKPTKGPTANPTMEPMKRPSLAPSESPTLEPTLKPAGEPTAEASLRPTHGPSSEPSELPTSPPSFVPTSKPTAKPLLELTTTPTNEPTAGPTLHPTKEPTAEPSPAPTLGPTAGPSLEPTPMPTNKPTVGPTKPPTQEPTAEPSHGPTQGPTARPSLEPSTMPTSEPTAGPTSHPTKEPAAEPSNGPTSKPTAKPSLKPSTTPTNEPTAGPTRHPTKEPTAEPSPVPTLGPTAVPSLEPTPTPTNKPTIGPTRHPTREPTAEPSLVPTLGPTARPSLEPTAKPTSKPTAGPTRHPTREPTAEPSLAPTPVPTGRPSLEPTATPTYKPTAEPSLVPTLGPTTRPSLQPTPGPTAEPTIGPTQNPTPSPTLQPSQSPTRRPTSRPTQGPTQDGCIPDDNELRWAVNTYLADDRPSSPVAQNYGHPIGEWCFGSGVTSFRSLFQNAQNFNENISGWSTTGITDMSWMFDNASKYNQPVNSWDVSHVHTMQSMFENAEMFDQPLDRWNISSVESMRFMFKKAYAFNAHFPPKMSDRDKIAQSGIINDGANERG